MSEIESILDQADLCVDEAVANNARALNILRQYIEVQNSFNILMQIPSPDMVVAIDEMETDGVRLLMRVQVLVGLEVSNMTLEGDSDANEWFVGWERAA